MNKELKEALAILEKFYRYGVYHESNTYKEHVDNNKKVKDAMKLLKEELEK